MLNSADNAASELGMHLLDRFKQGELRLTRIEAFSDGVFAIVVPLLVLELKVPALKGHASVSELAHALVDLLPNFLSWLISFIIVCKFWLNHHHLLGLARHANYAIVFAVNTLLFLALHAYIVRNLLKPELAALQDPHGMRKAMIGPASYVVSAAAAWFSIPAAFVIYALTPLFYITPPKWHGP